MAIASGLAQSIVQTFPEFMIQGHRGTRGLMPENSIPGMIKAIEDGANVLELDIQFTKDGEVVVAHDPYINRLYSLDPDGNEIPKSDAHKFIIYEMDYHEVRKFDVGSRPHPNFPKQEKFKTYIPTLGELINAVELHVENNNLEKIIYNIEIKANVETDGKFHPAPEQLVAQVMDVLASKNLNNRFYLQSFDIRQLQEARLSHPSVPVGFLTEDHRMTMAQHLKAIGFIPNMYSPYYKIATREMVATAHLMGMKFIPWTVNNTTAMKHLITMGVDGIITDYPMKLSKLRN